MDRREWKRLKDQINRGMGNVGIYKVDGDALRRENRSPLVKGGVVGFTMGGIASVAYIRTNPLHNRSPLGLFLDDYALVWLLIWTGGTLIGAAIGWLISNAVKPPKNSP